MLIGTIQSASLGSETKDRYQFLPSRVFEENKPDKVIPAVLVVYPGPERKIRIFTQASWFPSSTTAAYQVKIGEDTWKYVGNIVNLRNDVAEIVPAEKRVSLNGVSSYEQGNRSISNPELAFYSGTKLFYVHSIKDTKATKKHLVFGEFSEYSEDRLHGFFADIPTSLKPDELGFIDEQQRLFIPGGSMPAIISIQLPDKRIPKELVWLVEIKYR